MSLPEDPKERKGIPLWSGLFKYFPDALAEVARCSQVGGDQHAPGEPLSWIRGKSMDQEDCLLRHLMQSGTVDADGVPHSAKVAWRALAILQLELEARDAAQDTERDGDFPGPTAEARDYPPWASWEWATVCYPPRPGCVPPDAPWEEATLATGERVPIWYSGDAVYIHDPHDPRPYVWKPALAEYFYGPALTPELGEQCRRFYERHHRAEP